MDKQVFFRDSVYVSNSDLHHLGIEVQYFQGKRGETVLSWKLSI